MRQGEMPKLQIIAFDADDTLWHNQRFFDLSQERFAALLRPYAPMDDLIERLQAAEQRNLGHYGFGIKGFTLSMIESAIEVTDGNVPASVISELIAAGQEMLRHPIDLLPHVEETLGAIADLHRVMLITKGDLLDQERKLAQSGLGDLFDAVEIVSDKTPAAYSGIFARHAVAPDQVAMVGNSIRSDVIPVLRIGGWGIHVPQERTWAFEAGEAPSEEPRFRHIADIGQLPSTLEKIERS